MSKTAVQNTIKWNFVLFLSLLATLTYGKRPVQVFYFQADQRVPSSEAYVYDGDDVVAKTMLPHSNFTETFHVPDGNRRLHFWGEKLAIGEQLPDHASSVDIPKTWKKILLVVIQKEGSSDIVQVRALNASNSVFVDGSVCAVNFSEVEISGTLGDKALELNPEGSQIVEDPIAENGSYAAELFAMIKPGKKPQRFIKQMWRHDQGERQVLLILPLPAPRYVSYYSAPVGDL